MSYIDVTGKTEEEAIRKALQQLQMDRDDVSVEILERAKSGFLGIGSCPAKVKVSYEAPDEPEEGEYRIVRSKTFPIKPMTRDEAILQMNLLGHSFFAFRDEDADGAFALVYRRYDGDYGLIEDEL